MKLRDASLEFDGYSYPVQLGLDGWIDSKWERLPLRDHGSAFTASSKGIDARLTIKEISGVFSYTLSFTASQPTRLRLGLALPNAEEPFHVIPGCFFGDNNKAFSLGFGPVLSAEHPGTVLCSPSWELRADRSSLPISMLYAKGLLVAVEIDPYSEGRPLNADEPEDFIRNGLYAEVAHEGKPDSCGVTLGYAALPCESWSRKPEGPHLSLSATASGRIYIRPASRRFDVIDIVREEYAHHRQTPVPSISRAEAIESLVDAFLRMNWHDENGVNGLGVKPPPMTPFFGGTQIRENFTNMRCMDPGKQTLTAWRSLPELGWTGGGVIGYPLLAAGHRFKNALAVERAQTLLDRVADAYNPASGLLWDVCGKHEGKRVNWWYSGYLVQDCHCSYTNASGVWYLLRAYAFAQSEMKIDHPAWLDTACKALDTMVDLQLSDGNYGYTYAVDRKEVTDANGFAGVWFAAGMGLAYSLTKKRKYLDSAEKAMAYYHDLTVKLRSCGTPMDQHKWPDQEGNLGFLSAAQVLHGITGDPLYLGMLSDAGHYEYLWRYGQKTRPQFYPLKDPRWNSCGGSMTGVYSAIHPMGMIVNSGLLYLHRKTGDDYHLRRAQDGLNWGVNCVSLYPDVTGYGIRGVMTECWCQSNSRPGELRADGTPSTIWHSYNGWAAAATLEGLVDAGDAGL